MEETRREVKANRHFVREDRRRLVLANTT